MCIDITQKAPVKSKVSRSILRLHNAPNGSIGQLILEELSDLSMEKFGEFSWTMPRDEDGRREFWELYRERIAIMLENRKAPMPAQKLIAFESVVKSMKPWSEDLVPCTAKLEKK